MTAIKIINFLMCCMLKYWGQISQKRLKWLLFYCVREASEGLRPKTTPKTNILVYLPLKIDQI